MDKITSKLTTNALKAILNGNNVEKPIVQIWKLSLNTDVNRVRLFLSDGNNASNYAFLENELTHLLTEDKIDDFAIIQINKYNTMYFHEDGTQKCVIFILELTVLEKGVDVGELLGEPTALYAKSTIADKNMVKEYLESMMNDMNLTK